MYEQLHLNLFCRYAFVQYSSYFNAKSALEAVNMMKVKGRPVAVDWVVPKDQYEQSLQLEQVDQNGNGAEPTTCTAPGAKDVDTDKSGICPESGESDAGSHDSDVGSRDSDTESHDSDVGSYDVDTEPHKVADHVEEPGRLRTEDAMEGKTIFIRYV